MGIRPVGFAHVRLKENTKRSGLTDPRANEAKDAQVLPVLSHRPKPGTLHPEGVIRANEAKNAHAWPILLDTLNRKAPATSSGNRANEAKDAQAWQVMPASVCHDGTGSIENCENEAKDAQNKEYKQDMGNQATWDRNTRTCLVSLMEPMRDFKGCQSLVGPVVGCSLSTDVQAVAGPVLKVHPARPWRKTRERSQRCTTLASHAGSDVRPSFWDRGKIENELELTQNTQDIRNMCDQIDWGDLATTLVAPLRDSTPNLRRPRRPEIASS